MTRGEHYNRIISQTSQYQGSIGLSPTIIYFVLDFVNQHIWKVVAPTSKDDFRKPVTLSHAANLPADWTTWAGSAKYVDTNGVTRPFHYVHPEQLGYELTNTVDGATAAFPGLYFEDLKLRTLPAGLTGVILDYFYRPTAMVTAANDSIDDGMPDWTTGFVHQECARMLMELSDDEKRADETLVRRQAESLALTEKLIPMFNEAMLAGYQSTATK